MFGDQLNQLFLPRKKKRNSEEIFKQQLGKRKTLNQTITCGLQNDVSLGGGFKYFSCSSLFGEMIQFDEHIVQMGWFQLG